MSVALRVHVSNNWVLGTLVVRVVRDFWGKYMIFGYLQKLG